MECGVSKINITPKSEFGSLYIAGYATMEAPLIDGVHDPLHCRAMVITDGNEKIALISVDCVGFVQDFGNQVLSDIESLGFKRSRIFVFSTHTHAGPDTMGMWGPVLGKSGINPRYMLFLRHKIVESVEYATAHLKPVKIHYGKREIDKLIENYRRVKTVVNTLHLLQFKHENTIIGTLWTYPAQPEITDRENIQVSADYPGLVCSKIEEETGGVAIFGLGMCGSQSPFFVEQGFHKMELFANTLYEGIQQTVCELVLEAHSIEIRQRKVDLPLENDDFRLLQTLGIFNLPEKEDGIIESTVSKIRFGHLHIITIPGEPFPGLIQPLIEKYPDENFIILSHVNSSLGYFIPRNEWNLAPVEFLIPEKKEQFVGHEKESMGLKSSEVIQETVRDILKYKTVMAISPHADDISIFSGGLLAKFTDEGNKLICIRITDDYGDCVGLQPENAIKRNRKEAEKAYKALGADLIIHLDYPSDTLYTTDYERLREQFVRLIRTHQPNVVVTFDVAPLYEENPDHIITARLVNDACWQAAFDAYYVQHFNEGLGVHTVGERYLFSQSLNPQVVNFQLDITEYIEKKVNAVAQHQTVMKNWFLQNKLLARANHIYVELLEEDIPDPIRVNILVRAYYGEIGSQFGAKYGEIFRKVDAGFLQDFGAPI